MALIRHDASSEGALAGAIVETIAATIRAALRERGSASVVVTGGTTPRAYYPLLARLDLDWDKVVLLLSDERWVDAGNPDSNERLVRDYLLQGPAARARLVGLTTAAARAADGLGEATARVAAVAHPFDLVLLGIGPDTHVASLFPAAAGVARGLDPDSGERCIVLDPPPGIAPPIERISLTLPELLASRRILIAARGADKQRAIELALDGRWPQPTPLVELVQRAPAVELFWSP
jgi:6-phosphogluconolactonase